MIEQVLDSNLEEKTILTDVRWAGFWVRVGASIIDVLVILPLVGLNFYNLVYLKSLPLQLISDFMLLAYKPLMEYQFGATLGKMAVKIKVVNEIYEKISLSQSIIRYLPWLIGNLISIYSTILLFQNSSYQEASDFVELSKIQAQTLPDNINYYHSGLMIVTCLVVAFHAKKQGLHDLIASTYCIYKEE